MHFPMFRAVIYLKRYMSVFYYALRLTANSVFYSKTDEQLVFLRATRDNLY